jgi:Mn-containing catalase
VVLTAQQQSALEAFALRTASDPTGDPTTGADLGAGPGAGATKRGPAEP